MKPSREMLEIIYTGRGMQIPESEIAVELAERFSMTEEEASKVMEGIE